MGGFALLLKVAGSKNLESQAQRLGAKSDVHIELNFFHNWCSVV